MTIGERIRARRIDIGLSQTELADRADIAKQNLYKYEKNVVTNIPTDVIERLAEALHTSPAYLMGWAACDEAAPIGDDMASIPTGEKIKRLRRQNKMTQEDLGQRLGVTTTTISKWECGRVAEISPDQIFAMSEVFKVSPDELTDGPKDTPDNRVGECITYHPDDFQDRLNSALTLRDISKADLSRLTGLSKSSLTHYAKGDWGAKQEAVHALAQALNVSDMWLMGFDVPMEPSVSEAGSEDTAVFRELHQIPAGESLGGLIPDILDLIHREAKHTVFDSPEMEKLRMALFLLGYRMVKDDDQDGFIQLRMTGYLDLEAMNISLLPPKKSEIREAQDIFEVAEDVILRWIKARRQIFVASLNQDSPELDQHLAQLNQEGKEKVAEYVQDLLSNEKYKI